jgi:hypothetical protein
VQLFVAVGRPAGQGQLLIVAIGETGQENGNGMTARE